MARPFVKYATGSQPPSAKPPASLTGPAGVGAAGKAGLFGMITSLTIKCVLHALYIGKQRLVNGRASSTGYRLIGIRRDRDTPGQDDQNHQNQCDTRCLSAAGMHFDRDVRQRAEA